MQKLLLWKSVSLILGLLLLPSPSESAEQITRPPKNAKPIPEQWYGVWQVVDVKDDPLDKYHDPELVYKPNYGHLLGRIVEFKRDKLWNNNALRPDWRNCQSPKLEERRVGIVDFLEETIIGRLEGGLVLPNEMGLPIVDDAMVTVYRIWCGDRLITELAEYRLSDEHLNGDDEWLRSWLSDAWLMPLPNGRLAFRLEYNEVAILARVTPETKPKASFDCAKASNDAEKTICRSVELAAYDASVAEVYRFAMEYYNLVDTGKAEALKLKQTQKEWLKKRNSCKADETCLMERMAERVDQITSRRHFFEYHDGGTGWEETQRKKAQIKRQSP